VEAGRVDTLLGGLLHDRLRADGPLRFDAWMDAVLYDRAHGFYASGGRAGARAGDFLTSPEVGPLFGAVLATAVDRWWDEAGQPDSYRVAELGAGPGTLAAAVRLAAPRCAAALEWWLVEPTAQRVRHTDRLGARDGLDGPRLAAAGDVELVALAEVPDAARPDAVVANELLDNLPVRVAERTASGWFEVWVAATTEGDAPVFVEHLVALDPDSAEVGLLDRLVPEVTPGARVPIQQAATDWLDWALQRTDGGPVVVIDYADDTAGMAERGEKEWLRTYAAHGRGGSPFGHCGDQDVTCDVATDQLAAVRTPTSDRTQADFLRHHGIGDLVEEGKRVWRERAHVGDLAAVRARSRVTEAEALCDPAGLGAHRVLEWHALLQGPDQRHG
jgi:SAM-dependent MidA family methyltransferase